VDSERNDCFHLPLEADLYDARFEIVYSYLPYLAAYFKREVGEKVECEELIIIGGT
jgi:hypothetical protein